METSKILKDYAKKYFSIFNVKPEVQRYYNENESKHIDVLSVQYFDFPNIIFYSTIGLSTYDFGITSKSKSLRMEIVTAFYKDFQFAGNLLSHCSFDIIDSMSLSPNLIIPNIVSEYINSELTDVWVKFPNLFENSKDITTEYDDQYVTVLQLMPISYNESLVVLTEGGKKLGDMFLEKDIDQFNINRKPIL